VSGIGFPNDAMAPVPSAQVADPYPARVVTTFVATTAMRMRLLLESDTNSTVPSPMSAMSSGALNLAKLSSYVLST
jgi:hypothetical protein